MQVASTNRGYLHVWLDIWTSEQAATPKQKNIYGELLYREHEPCLSVAGPSGPCRFYDEALSCVAQKSGPTNVLKNIKTIKNLCVSFVPPRPWGHCLHPNEQLTLVQLVGQRNLVEQDVTSTLNLSQNSPKGSYSVTGIVRPPFKRINPNCQVKCEKDLGWERK